MSLFILLCEPKIFPGINNRAQHLHIVPRLAQVIPNFHLLHLIQNRVPHQFPIPLMAELEVGFVI